MLQVILDIGDAPKDLRSFLELVGRIDRGVGLVSAVEEGEELVILFLCQGIVFMTMALRALNRQAEDSLADGVHPVEHRFHAELLGVDAPFLVDHRVAQESGRDDLILRGVGLQVSSDLVGDEFVVREVGVEGVDHPVAVEPDLA